MPDLISVIKEQVSLYQVLARYKWDFMGGGFPEQISCPFHRPDINKSARIYPDTNTMYCFTCRKTWDVVEFVKDKEECSIKEACEQLRSWFNVIIDLPSYESKLYSLMGKHPKLVSFDEVVFSVDSRAIQLWTRMGRREFKIHLPLYNELWVEREDLVAQVCAVAELMQWYEKVKQQICLINQKSEN